MVGAKIDQFAREIAPKVSDLANNIQLNKLAYKFKTLTESPSAMSEPYK